MIYYKEHAEKAHGFDRGRRSIDKYVKNPLNLGQAKLSLGMKVKTRLIIRENFIEEFLKEEGIIVMVSKRNG